MEKGGGHETRAPCEVMLSTIGLGERGTPVRGWRGRMEGKMEGEDVTTDIHPYLLMFC